MNDHDRMYNMLKKSYDDIELTIIFENKVIRVDDYDHVLEFTFDKDGNFLHFFIINYH